jgi:prolipoprotein diacylglyceryl transferase
MPFQLHLYGLCVGLGVVLAVEIVERLLKENRIAIKFSWLVGCVLASGIIGARIYHLVTDWPLYTNRSWLDWFAIWNGGLGFLGAIIGGVLGLYLGLLVQKKQNYFLQTLDYISISIPFAQAIGRWGNFFNQELFGLPTTLPWGISISANRLPSQFSVEQRFHPIFLYESLLNLILGFVLFWLYKRGKAKQKGTLLGIYLIGYSIIRFWLEFLRIESARGFLPWITIAQWWTLLIGGTGIILLLCSVKNKSSLAV